MPKYFNREHVRMIERKINRGTGTIKRPLTESLGEMIKTCDPDIKLLEKHAQKARNQASKKY